MTKTVIVRVSAALAALLGVAFAVGSIGGGDADRTSVLFSQTGSAIHGGSSQEGFADRDLAVPAPADEPAAAPGEDAAAVQELRFDDRIIRTADLSVEVPEGAFDEVWDRALKVADRFGGSVLTTSRGSGDPEREAVAFGELTIRVPSERFEEAAIAVRALGEVRSDQTSSQDVTEEYVDLTSRLRHLRAQEDALLTLMGRARSVQDILVVQRELANVQAEIERVTGRINFLDARTEFSTISLRLGEPGVFTLSKPPSEGPSFAKAWETALEGLERMATAGMIVVLWAAPFALLAAIGAWVLRRRRPVPEVGGPAHEV